jgi:ribonuclease-3 family protein
LIPPLAASPPEHWLLGLSPNPPLGDLGALQLAWLGDAVWELHQRQIRCRQPGRAEDLHRQVVAAVRAAAQAQALQRLQGLLSEAEQQLVRRGRNRAGRGPRSADPSIYAQATGFEALLGWLFLHDPPRLVELLDHLQDVDPDSFSNPPP